MQEQLIAWINGLKSSSTEYTNECNQNILQFSQDPNNFRYFVDILNETTDIYILKAALHILRSSLRMYQDFPPEYAFELLTVILQIFSKNENLDLLFPFKSLIRLLIILTGDENYTDLLMDFFFQNQKTNKIASMIMINIMYRMVDLEDEQLKKIHVIFLRYTHHFFETLSSVRSNEYKARLLSYALNIIECSSTSIGSKEININLIVPYAYLFKNGNISIKAFYKLWRSIANIFVSFKLFGVKDKFLFELLKYTITIPNPIYLYYAICSFIPFFKDKEIPFKVILAFINCEMLTIKKSDFQIGDCFFFKKVVKNAIIYYNSEEEINEIYNRFIQEIQNSSTVDDGFIVYYGYLIKNCANCIKIDFQFIIQFFDELFKEESSPNCIYACLYALSYVIDSLTNNLKDISNHFFDRILACTLSDIKEIREKAFNYFDLMFFEANHSNFLKISQSILDNQDEYLKNNPYEFFKLVITCSNFNLPLPENLIETWINEILLPLIKEDLQYIKLLGGLLCANEFWIEPYMQLLNPLFETQIDEEISVVTDGSLGQSNNIKYIIEFFVILVESYGKAFYDSAQKYIHKLFTLFFKIDVINTELHLYIIDRLSIALEYLDDVEECDKLTNYILISNIKINFRINENFFCRTIRHYSPELVKEIFNQIVQLLQESNDQPLIISCLKILAKSVKNSKLNEEYFTELSQFMRQYCTEVVLENMTCANFFYNLGSMLTHFPDYPDWIQYLLSNAEKISANKFMFEYFFYFCIFQQLFLDNIPHSTEIDDAISQMAVQVYNEMELTSFLKSSSILTLSLLMEQNRSSIAVQFFKENVESFIQNLKDDDNCLISQSALIILNGVLTLTDCEVDVDLLKRCCEIFPYNSELDVNIFFIRYSIMIIDKSDDLPYASQIELQILDSFFKYLKRPYQKFRQLEFGNLRDNLVNCFKNLAEKNHDFTQKKIDELDDFPSEKKRIMNILSPPENEGNDK